MDFVMSLLGGGDKPGSASSQAVGGRTGQTAAAGGSGLGSLLGLYNKTESPRDDTMTPNMLKSGADKLTTDSVGDDAFGALLQQMMSQKNPNQQLRKQQLAQQLQLTPFTDLLGQ